MAEVIRMPKMSDTMQEGVLVAWHKQPGDTVKIGDILAEVETDKATMELEAYEEGTLLYIGPKPQDKVPIDGVLAIIGEKGEDYQALLATAAPSAPAAEAVAETPTATPPPVTPPATPQSPSAPATPPPPAPVAATTSQVSPSSTPPKKASPLAQKMAKEQGINLHSLQGSGPAGRIVKRDLAQATPGIVSTTINLQERYKDETPSSMRKTIAQRLTTSKNQAPHFYLTVTVEMDPAIALRAELKEHTPTKVSINDLIVLAVGRALRKHPEVNVAWLNDTMRYYEHIHLGIAVALDDGLVVPVWKFADQRTLLETAQGVRALAEQARAKQLRSEDLQGSTFTISNLGMLGITSFTAIINPPAACVLAVGAVQEQPLCKNSELYPGHVLQLTLSCDHRAVDGAVGAAFLASLKALLEAPSRLLI